MKAQFQRTVELSSGVFCELARVLEPWLYQCPTYHFFHGSNPEETRRWWRRFLD
ncbi:DUF3396 domain-containing protein [Archangium violaceum]|uniref:hypothetical protein n=1 Tax=Archangium violaceum TaxID=83451 RepID=UPI002B2E8E42|nr:DUF3396 domain-containing protein [Archangium violaceum]